MSTIVCEKCRRSLSQVKSMHRQNEKGVKGIWRCNYCNTRPVPVVAQILIDAMDDPPGVKQ